MVDELTRGCSLGLEGWTGQRSPSQAPTRPRQHHTPRTLPSAATPSEEIHDVKAKQHLHSCISSSGEKDPTLDLYLILLYSFEIEYLIL